ncbi:MAG: FAD-binding oxidoreductase [Anaerolineaceae bacterium]|nr:FAD-binding oxidoreductase [Anaerolineaceae bacterium]
MDMELTQIESSYSELQAQVEGKVIAPADAGYDEARLAWNRKVEQHPAVIVVAKTAQDVAAAVSFARQHDLGVAVQGTGHGNVRPADDCLLILTQEMNQVTINPTDQTAYVAAGVKWGAVLAAAQQHGLAPLLGSSPMVGVVGYTLGGGLGWLARKYGLSADNVVAFELVTADGQLRTASEDENPDLFWGLRGGGGSLGIVTSLIIRLFPVTEVYAGNLFYPASMAQEVFRRYRDWIADAPDELTSSVLIMNFPPIPDLPEFLRGQSFAIVRGCYCGDLGEGEALLHYWRDWQPPLVDDFKTIPFSAAATISSDPVDPMPAANSGAWLRELSDAAIDAIVTYALGMDGSSPLTFAEVRHAGGAIRRVAAATAVYGNREAELVLSLVGVTPTPEAYQQLAAYIGQLNEALRPSLTGGVYMNFLEGTESQQRVRDGLASGGYERLARLKAQVDPENRLRYSFNVPAAH